MRSCAQGAGAIGWMIEGTECVLSRNVPPSWFIFQAHFIRSLWILSLSSAWWGPGRSGTKEFQSHLIENLDNDSLLKKHQKDISELSLNRKRRFRMWVDWKLPELRNSVCLFANISPLSVIFPGQLFVQWEGGILSCKNHPNKCLEAVFTFMRISKQVVEFGMYQEKE